MNAFSKDLVQAIPGRAVSNFEPMISSLTHVYLHHTDTMCLMYYTYIPLPWRHNWRNGISNHQPHHCLLNRPFRRRSKKTLKLGVTGLCVGNSSVTGEFPAQMASNAEIFFIWWRHHVMMSNTVRIRLLPNWYVSLNHISVKLLLAKFLIQNSVWVGNYN